MVHGEEEPSFTPPGFKAEIVGLRQRRAQGTGRAAPGHRHSHNSLGSEVIRRIDPRNDAQAESFLPAQRPARIRGTQQTQEGSLSQL